MLTGQHFQKQSLTQVPLPEPAASSRQQKLMTPPTDGHGGKDHITAGQVSMSKLIDLKFAVILATMKHQLSGFHLTCLLSQP